MRDPFAAALAVLHSSAGAAAAIYTPAGSAPLPINVILDQGTQEAGTSGGTVLIDVNAVQIMRGDVAQPMAGDHIAIGQEDFVIQGGARLDVEGVTWTCDLEPA